MPVFSFVLPHRSGTRLRPGKQGVVIILWDSAAEAANGANEIGPTWFAQHIAPHLASEQQRSVGEVIVQHEA